MKIFVPPRDWRDMFIIKESHYWRLWLSAHVSIPFVLGVFLALIYCTSIPLWLSIPACVLYLPWRVLRASFARVKVRELRPIRRYNRDHAEELHRSIEERVALVETLRSLNKESTRANFVAMGSPSDVMVFCASLRLTRKKEWFVGALSTSLNVNFDGGSRRVIDQFAQQFMLPARTDRPMYYIPRYFKYIDDPSRDMSGALRDLLQGLRELSKEETEHLSSDIETPSSVTDDFPPADTIQEIRVKITEMIDAKKGAG